MELARSSPESQQLSRAQELVLAELSDGTPAFVVAKRIAKGDPKVARRWRAKIRYWSYNVPAFQTRLGLESRAESMLLTPVAVHALGRRAARGRVDAIRLLFEISGFHNPKVQHNHEHSGEIKISLEMGGRPEPIVDAEVVE